MPTDPGLPPETLHRALEEAQRALAGVTRGPEEELEVRGFRVRIHPLSVPGALVRARVDLDQRRVLLDPQGLEDLEGRLRGRGWKVPARTLALAHELFHVLDPRCPGPLAELAAHLFAGALLDLEGYPGELDEARSTPWPSPPPLGLQD